MKAHPNDKQLVRNENGDPVERSSAAARLAADGCTDHFPIIVAWLTHENWFLRVEAAKMLLIWQYEPALDATIAMLLSDPVFEVRLYAANSLLSVQDWEPSPIEKVATIMKTQLKKEENPDVVRAIYGALLRIYGETTKARSLPLYFDPDIDVDWSLLQSS